MCTFYVGIRVEHKRSQVQSPLEVNFFLNLFCSYLRKPFLPALLTLYNVTRSIDVTSACSSFLTAGHETKKLGISSNL